MKKRLLPGILFAAFSFLFLSFSSPLNIEPGFQSSNISSFSQSCTYTTSDFIDKARNLTSVLCEKLSYANSGLSTQAISMAIKGYEKLVENGEVHNTRYLTIVDLSQSSSKKRFYLLDIKNSTLVLNTYVAHGKNSGLEEASKFSNERNSEETSLGFYVTDKTYSGKHGLSLRLSGLEDGINDNAESRGIVVHGASYVSSNRARAGYIGRSQGCPALPEKDNSKIIKLIKNGSVFFIYHPSPSYLNHSGLLNS